MKKYLILPAIIGLVAVPSLAFAQHAPTANPTWTTDTVSSTIAKPMITSTEMANTDTATATDTTTTSTTAPKTDVDGTKPPIVVPEGSLTADQAKAIAAGLYPDLTVTKVEAEMEHGVLVYEVTFSDGSKVTILASDGTVVTSESENSESHAPNYHSVLKSANGNHFGQLKHDD